MFERYMEICTKRRTHLINVLEGNTQEIDPCTQHKLYGAINEIGFIIDALHYYEEKNSNNGKEHGIKEEQVDNGTN
ncbi:hypothetical protein JW930_02275 [Candidatus Woesearchaeota archaeon]|nr:hypothetical protein [Candidatus Woesearchaeota archaeon]